MFMAEAGVKYLTAQPLTFRVHNNRAFENHLNIKCTRKVFLKELFIL
jgi:hypothetical protein